MSTPATYQDESHAPKLNCLLWVQENSLTIAFENDIRENQIWPLTKDLVLERLQNTAILKKGNSILLFKGPLIEQLNPLVTDYYEKSLRERTQRNKQLRIGAAYALLLLVAVYVLWFLLLPWAGEKVANFVPEEMEIQLGQRWDNLYFGESNNLDSASFYLNQFAGSLKTDDHYPITMRVINSQEINAYALPGGRIVVFSGILIKMSSYEQLVALLGHELTHINKRHSLKSICRQAAGSIVLSGLFGDFSGIGSGILSQANQLKELNYSRELETEADEEGLKFMEVNHVNPRGMYELLVMLKEEGIETPGLMKYLSTHPDTEARISNILTKIKCQPIQKEDPGLRTSFEKLKQVLDSDRMNED